MRTLSLEERVRKIEERNSTVAKDKAWETSYTRKLLIIFFTYISLALYFKFVIGIDPWINAIVPTVGFYLSTLSLPFLKSVWIKYLYKSK